MINGLKISWRFNSMEVTKDKIVTEHNFVATLIILRGCIVKGEIIGVSQK